jgi:hypothetical protein
MLGSQGAEIKFSPRHGAKITNCGSGSGSFLFIKDVKKFYRKKIMTAKDVFVNCYNFNPIWVQKYWCSTVWWNRKYFLRFRFRFRKVMVPVPVPTFEKVMVPVPVPVPAPYLYHKKLIFLKKFVSFLQSKLFYKEKDYKYQQIHCEM